MNQKKVTKLNMYRLTANVWMYLQLMWGGSCSIYSNHGVIGNSLLSAFEGSSSSMACFLNKNLYHPIICRQDLHSAILQGFNTAMAFLRRPWYKAMEVKVTLFTHFPEWGPRYLHLSDICFHRIFDFSLLLYVFQTQLTWKSLLPQSERPTFWDFILTRNDCLGYSEASL